MSFTPNYNYNSNSNYPNIWSYCPVCSEIFNTGLVHACNKYMSGMEPTKRPNYSTNCETLGHKHHYHHEPIECYIDKSDSTIKKCCRCGHEKDK